MNSKFWLDKLKGSENLRDLGVEIRCELDLISLKQSPVVDSCEHSNETFSFHTRCGISNQLSDYQLLKKDSARGINKN
jgi:hypothetical protein